MLVKDRPPTLKSTRAAPYRVETDEPLTLLVDLIADPSDLAVALADLRGRRARGLTATVILPARRADAWAEAVGEWRARFGRLVVTGEPVTDLAFPKGTVVEPDPFRAVVGAMQSLQADDTFVLLAATSYGLNNARDLIAQGTYWRAAWEAPDDGEFHRRTPTR